jgi:hypothetical protein
LRRTNRNIIALLIVAVLAACGGGGGGGSSLAPSGSGGSGSGSGGSGSGAGGSGSGGGGSTTLPSGFLTASVKITVPNASAGNASVRRTKLVEPNTQSITFTLLQTTGSSTGSSPQTFTLTTANPNCTSSASGLSCVLGVAAPVGTDVFLAQTYSGTAGTGTLTGSGAVKFSVAQNASNTASISLDGTVSAVYLATSQSYLGVPPYNYNNGGSHARVAATSRRTPLSSSGVVSSFQVIPIAVDSNNDPILNPSTYDAPIVLQLLYINQNASETDTTSTPDVTLSVAYNASVDPGGCGGNASTSALFGTVTVCSPSDTITATIANVVGGAQAASILAGFGSNPVYFTNEPASPTPMPLPQATPAGFNFVQFSVSPSVLSVTDGNGVPISVTNPITFLATGAGYAQYVYVTDFGFSGALTFGGNCAPYISASSYNYGGGYYYLTLTPNAVGICTGSVSDGTNTRATRLPARSARPSSAARSSPAAAAAVTARRLRKCPRSRRPPSAPVRAGRPPRRKPLR